MNWRIVFRRMIGSLLFYLLVLPSVAIGYLLSPSLYVAFLGIGASLNIAIRIVSLLLGLFWLYKLLVPYSKHFFSIKAGDNLLFDEGPNLFGKFTVKLALSLIGASTLIGFGAFGFMIFLANLLFGS